MTTFQIDVDDGLAQTLDALLPPNVDPEDWLTMKAEQAIAQTHLDQRTQAIQQARADLDVGGVPDDALVTNDDVQPRRDADAGADD